MRFLRRIAQRWSLRWRRDAGDQTTTYILVVALGITIALAVGPILVDTMTEGAQEIDLGMDP